MISSRFFARLHLSLSLSLLRLCHFDSTAAAAAATTTNRWGRVWRFVVGKRAADSCLFPRQIIQWSLNQVVHTHWISCFKNQWETFVFRQGKTRGGVFCVLETKRHHTHTQERIEDDLVNQSWVSYSSRSRRPSQTHERCVRDLKLSTQFARCYCCHCGCNCNQRLIRCQSSQAIEPHLAMAMQDGCTQWERGSRKAVVYVKPYEARPGQQTTGIDG